MQRTNPPQFYQVYLDTSTIVDLDPSENRNPSARILYRLLENYSSGEVRIQVLTSQWALAEAQGVFYKKELELRGIQPPKKPDGTPRDIRNTFPPITDALADASNRLKKVIKILESLYFELYTPPIGDSLRLWQFVQRIGEESAIFPADSVHLAMALLGGCSMLVVTDFDFIDKCDHFRDKTIKSIRMDIFPDIYADLPEFKVCCLGAGGTRPGRGRKVYKPAIVQLKELGYI